MFHPKNTQRFLIHALKPFCVLLQFAEDNSALWTTAGSQLFLQAGANLRPGSAVLCFSYSATFCPSFCNCPLVIAHCISPPLSNQPTAYNCLTAGMLHCLTVQVCYSVLLCFQYLCYTVLPQFLSILLLHGVTLFASNTCIARC
jgi:hypothetical protein